MRLAGGVRNVVAFSAATGDYHVPVRRARWSAASAVERVLVVSAERGGGAQYFVPRALGRAFRAFWLGEPADCYPPTITVEQVHGAARPAADAARIAQLAGLLSDRARAEPPATFPKDAAAADAPGLYAWWGDEEAVRVIGGALGGQVGSLLYVGQAGATSRVAGKRSNATLASRIRGQHIRAQTRASTFARTMAAVLREPMQLELAAPGLLTEHSRQRLSCWICEHLQVAVVPVPAPDTLTAVEDAVLAALDPPLNLDAMPRTPQRRRLSELRSELGRAGLSALPAVTRLAAGRRSSAAAGLRPAADGFDEVWDRIRRHAGDTFTLVRGQQFTYQVTGNNVLPAGRQRLLHKSNFARASLPHAAARNHRHKRRPGIVVRLRDSHRPADQPSPAVIRIRRTRQASTQAGAPAAVAAREQRCARTGPDAAARHASGSHGISSCRSLACVIKGPSGMAQKSDRSPSIAQAGIIIPCPDHQAAGANSAGPARAGVTCPPGMTQLP